VTQRDFGANVGKFHDFVAAVAIVCVVFGSMVYVQRAIEASVGKFHDFIAAVAVVWVACT
jgi:hypothetical protein